MTTAYMLSEDRRTLVIKRRMPGGVLTSTFHRLDAAGPFTDEDVTTALSASAAAARMQPGQRNITRRAVTRWGTLWTHVMLGPPNLVGAKGKARERRHVHGRMAPFRHGGEV